MRGDRGRIGVRLDGDQFQVGAVRETGQRHFGGVIGVRTAVLALDTDAGERPLHRFQILAGYRNVIDVKCLRHGGHREERAAE